MKKCRSVLVGLAAGLAIGGVTSGCSDPTSATAAAPTASNASAAVPIAPNTSGAVRRVDVAEFANVISTPGVQVIDVRTPEEFASGRIRGAINIPVTDSDFGQRVSQLDPASTYAVYCRSGNRSQPAVTQMRAAGITNIIELDSGTNGWATAGQPLVS